MKINTQSMKPVEMEVGTTEEVNSFTYVESVVYQEGALEEEDVTVRIGRVRTVFRMLHRMWKLREISEMTEVRIFSSSWKYVLLYDRGFSCERNRVLC